MNLTDISSVRALLHRHGFTFSKALGQNFLINPSVCPKMAEMSGIDGNSGVIEIGPGIGVLTAELAKIAKKTVAIELDKRLLPVLEETLPDRAGIEVINADALKIDFHKLISEKFTGLDVFVCANLPYYITSPVIMHLLESRLPVKAITVMVQKEAAARICAPVGTRLSGAITVSVNYFSSPEKLFDVSRGSFMPSPNVDSSVIRFNIHDKPPIDVKNEKMLAKTIKAAFSQRRKTLLNSLSSGLGIPKGDLNDILKSIGIDILLRAEQLSLTQFETIVNALDSAATQKQS